MDGADESVVGCVRASASRAVTQVENLRDSVEHVVLRQLWQLYVRDVLPLERLSHFGHFHVPPTTAEEFEARPQVLLLGQYSTGKTSMVKWLTGRDSVHFDVRPQPSTDKFIVVVHGEEERLIHGSAATCLPQLPYQGLASFGATFLSNFQAVTMPSEMLRQITFIDTPGVLSGCKQRIGRNYEYSSICAWMAERADLILLTFDAHKLDISDEFQEVMEVLRPFADRVRCVLNKADQIDAANLVRVYGALLWNVGKVLRTPEVARVYISSFWDESYRYKDHRALFDEDKAAVLKELEELPRTAVLRKINAFVMRVRLVKTHLCIVTHIHENLPWLLSTIGATTRLERWLDEKLPSLFDDVQRIRGLSPGDMPSIENFRLKLGTFESLSHFPAWDADAIAKLDRVVEVDVPRLIGQVAGVSTVSISCRSEKEPVQEQGGFLDFLGLGCKRQRLRQAPCTS